MSRNTRQDNTRPWTGFDKYYCSTHVLAIMPEGTWYVNAPPPDVSLPHLHHNDTC